MRVDAFEPRAELAHRDAAARDRLRIGKTAAFDALGADDQKVVEAEFGAGFARLEATNRSDNTAAREALKQQGITIDAPTDADSKTRQAVGEDVFKQLSSEGALTPEMLKALTSALVEARGGATK